jgi:hypothetical protein
MEEVAILEREASDMCAHYNALQRQTSSQLAVITQQCRLGEALPVPLWLGSQPPVSTAARQAMETALYAGHQARLRGQLVWLKARHDDALNTLSKIRARNLAEGPDAMRGAGEEQQDGAVAHVEQAGLHAGQIAAQAAPSAGAGEGVAHVMGSDSESTDGDTLSEDSCGNFVLHARGSDDSESGDD